MVREYLILPVHGGVRHVELHFKLILQFCRHEPEYPDSECPVLIDCASAESVNNCAWFYIIEMY